MTESHSVKVLNGADLPGQSILTPADRTLIMTKHYANRLSFAVLLLFFRDRGRFPRTASEIDRSIVQAIAQQLLIQMIPVDYTVSLSGRTVERHRAEIRALLGFREATVADVWTSSARRAPPCSQLVSPPSGPCHHLLQKRPDLLGGVTLGIGIQLSTNFTN
jgi:Domain of unknown function (DUF4158)